jgi:hypothetical protein
MPSAYGSNQHNDPGRFHSYPDSAVWGASVGINVGTIFLLVLILVYDSISLCLQGNGPTSLTVSSQILAAILMVSGVRQLKGPVFWDDMCIPRHSRKDD